MTDGPTGIQVAPTEDEMNSASDILKRMISAVVGMSQLQADVNMLRETVAGLQADADRLRRNNEALDEALSQSRQARQHLEGEAKANYNAMLSAQAERDSAIRQRDYVESQLTERSNALTQALDERDKYCEEVLVLEDKLKTAEAKLATIQNALGMTTPQPEPPKPVEPEPEMPWNEPKPTLEPEPTEPNRTYLNKWEAGAIWDNDKRQYYREEAIPF